MYTPRDLRSSDPRGSPRSALLRNRAVISGTTVLTQLPGQGVTTGLKRTERRGKKRRKKKRRNVSHSRRAFPGFMVWWLFCDLLLPDKKTFSDPSARLSSVKCRAVSSVSSAILSATAASCCNLRKFRPSARHAAAVTSRMTLKAGPARRYNARCRFEWPSLQRIPSTMDLPAILHSHKIAHNVPGRAFASRSRKKRKRSGRFTIYQNPLSCHIVLYRFSALEIYIRDPFVRGPVAPLLNGENRMNDGGSPCWCHFRVVDRDIWGLWRRVGIRDRVATDSPPPPAPRWNILFSHDDASPPPGLTARTHTRRPPRNPSLNAYAGEYRRGRHDTMSLHGVVHVATKAATNARGIASP